MATTREIQNKYGQSVSVMFKELSLEPYEKNKHYEHGYNGILLYNTKNNKIICPICNKEFYALGTHLTGTHQIYTEDFREKMGLPKNLPLCTKEISRKISETTENQRKLNQQFLTKRVVQTKRHKKAIRKYKESYFFKNKYGYCDAQIKARLVNVMNESNKISLSFVTNKDIIKHDIKLYNFLKRKYGSVKAGILEYGMVYVGKNKYDKIKLISELRRYVKKHQKIPTKREVVGVLPQFETYRRHFGSWRNAVKSANLDELLS